MLCLVFKQFKGLFRNKSNVINLKTAGDTKLLSPHAIYVGRSNKSRGLSGSPLQNNFVIGHDGNRTQVIEKYRQWLWKEVKKRSEVYESLKAIASEIKAGKDIKLACYCSPQPCHADIIKRCLDWMIRENIV